MLLTFIHATNSLIAIFASCFLLYIGVRLFRAYLKHRQLAGQSSAGLLCELKQSTEPEAKAKIFISLMLIGYVMIHKMINAGIKYDDDKHRRQFERFLTEDTVRKLNTIGEHKR